VSLNPNYSYRFYEVSKEPFSFAKNLYDSIDRPKISYSAGIFVERHLSEKFKIRLGLNMMKMGYGTKKLLLRGWGSQGGNGVFDPGMPGDSSMQDGLKLSYNNFYIEIPLDFQYFMGSKKRLFVDLGFSPCINFLNKVNHKTYFPDGRVESKTKEDKAPYYRKVGLTTQFGFGYNMPIFKKYVLEIQPRFQLFVTPASKSINTSSFNVFFYNGGLQFAVKV
jgi:Outer membrane protein beta-barrel domain